MAKNMPWWLRTLAEPLQRSCCSVLVRIFCLAFIAIFTSLTVWFAPLFMSDATVCWSKPCKNGGICDTKGDGTFTCTCAAGWEKETCKEGKHFHNYIFWSSYFSSCMGASLWCCTLDSHRLQVRSTSLLFSWFYYSGQKRQPHMPCILESPCLSVRGRLNFFGQFSTTLHKKRAMPQSESCVNVESICLIQQPNCKRRQLATAATSHICCIASKSGCRSFDVTGCIPLLRVLSCPG